MVSKDGDGPFILFLSGPETFLFSEVLCQLCDTPNAPIDKHRDNFTFNGPSDTVTVLAPYPCVSFLGAFRQLRTKATGCSCLTNRADLVPSCYHWPQIIRWPTSVEPRCYGYIHVKCLNLGGDWFQWNGVQACQVLPRNDTSPRVGAC
jgi:hypothetical protein